MSTGHALPRSDEAISRESSAAEDPDTNTSVGPRVQQPAHEPFPSRHELDLVEAPQDGRAGRLCREQAGVFVENEAEVARGKIEQSLILERQVGHQRQGTAPGDDVCADLVQERGLPCATHPDDGRGLAGKPESTTNAT